MRPENANAKALYAFLEREWAAMDIRPTAWCRKVGLADATVLRWREGIEPDMKSLRRIADALGRPLLDVLIEAGYIDRDEAGGYLPMQREYDLIETIKLDAKLEDGEREALRQLHDAFVAAKGSDGHKRVRKIKGTIHSS